MAAGVRSLLAPWIGGAGAPVIRPGFRSPAIWLGLSAPGEAVVGYVTPLTPGGPNEDWFRIRIAEEIRQEDNDIMEIIAIVMASGVLDD